jgi:sterol desaturase/sphingolipid hydroxylase (fatty acid hydroxylase superfamily)
MNDPHDSDHWLTRPSTIRRLWWLFSIVLAILVALQLVIKVKGYFGIDGWFGFGAAFGFLSCLLMVLFAKALGFVLKRPQSYYGEGNDDA